MRKLIWLTVMLLLLAGCSKPNNTIETNSLEDTTNAKGYMADPQIFISTGHQYNDEGWMDDDVDFKDSVFEANGDIFGLNIIFPGSFNEEKLKKAVTVEGFLGTPEMSVLKSSDKTVLHVTYRDIENNKKYKLIISKNLTDEEGKTLKADIEKEITLKPDTKALYSFHGAEAIYENLGKNTIMDAYAVGAMNLSPAPKTISIDFTAEVDKQSVEQSIIEELQGKGVKCSFKWDGEKSVLLGLDNFKSEEDRDYVISMKKAKDAYGNSIYGNLYFVVGKANWLGAIDIKSKADSILKKFIDKRYMVVQSPSIGKDIVIDDTEAKYVFNLDTMKTVKIDIPREYIGGIPGLKFIHSWKGSSDNLLLNRTTGQLIDYSTLDGSSKELFILPVEIMSGNVMSIAASPDGNKLAVAYEVIVPGMSYDHKDGFHVDIFDMKGKLLYKLENLFKPRYMEIFGPIADIQWFDNDNIILEDNLSTENHREYNVVGINIKTGKKSLIAEHSYKPVTMPGKNLIKLERFEDFGKSDGKVEIIKSGKVVSGFETKFNEYSNFFFVDENTLVCNRADEIVMYSIADGKPEVLGKGYIIGLSQDKSKLYYLTNHKMLYYID